MMSKEEAKTFELIGMWLQLFGKGMRLKNGLNKNDRKLIQQYTNQILKRRSRHGVEQ